ncbi:MAG: LysR family transcriptional regulator [Limnobacter sp.]|uniref:LysR family transcriptional regulator n=1 Tax=Limnobacter sp. TaxID=2003368 RepID=UPI00391C966D
MANRLELLRIFCAAAEANSFKEAAQRLGISPQAVTRAIQELEGQFGELLFHRNTRQSQITTFGEGLATAAKSRVQGIDELFRTTQHKGDKEATGLVRIAAPSTLGDGYLVPPLAELAGLHPGLRFDVRLSDQVSDVVDEQIDIGLRVGFMRDSRFVARTVCNIPFLIVGTPGLVARVGKPKNLDDLENKPTTVTLDPNTGRPWPWFLSEGRQWHPKAPVFMSTDGRAEVQAVLAGMGFGQLTAYFAIPHLRTGQLVELLPKLAPTPWTLNVYRPQRGPVPARIRVVYDHLVKVFSDVTHFPR